MGFLALGIVILILALLFSAMILKISCTFVSVQQPSWGKACGIVIVSGIIHTLANVMLGMFLAGGDPMFNGLLSLVVSTAVSAGVYSAMLETEFWRGLVICVIQAIIGAVIGIVLFIFLFGAFLGTQGSPSRRSNRSTSPSIVQPEEPERPTSFEVKE